MRIAIALIMLAALATSAHAREINLPLTDEEQAAFMRILDVATKAGGLEIAPATLHLANKIRTYQLQGERPAVPAAPNK